MGTGVIEMVEPYRIKVVESIPRITRAARLKALSTAGFNTFFETKRANIAGLGAGDPAAGVEQCHHRRSRSPGGPPHHRGGR